MLIIAYIIFSTIIFNKIQDKIAEVNIETKNIGQQIAAIKSDITKVDQKSQEYKDMVKALDEINQVENESRRLKYSIPTLLHEIMNSIPVNVQITSINNSDTKVTIVAQSHKYEQLGIFVAKLNQDGILSNIVTDKSQKQNNLVVVTIEGELP